MNHTGGAEPCGCFLGARIGVEMLCRWIGESNWRCCAMRVFFGRTDWCGDAMQVDR